MNATGTWVVPTRAFEASLAELKEWRGAVARESAAFRRWALVARLIDEQAMARLAHLERRMQAERLTVVFVGEPTRGKSELVNALFFADFGARLLPVGNARTTLCPTEILWDPGRAPSLRLLRTETREDPRSLRELMNEPGWHEIALDPAQPQAIAEACQCLSESVAVSAADAASLGFAADGQDRVEVPRWRYAILNLPHPLLASGLAVLDTPGRAALAAEPEIGLHRLPDAAAIVFVLDATQGLADDDRALWKEHIAPMDGLEQTCFIALNKIDLLRDGHRSEGQVLGAIDREVKAAADALGVAPTRVFALSALQAAQARAAGDRDSLMRSRLYRLEQALAKGMVHQRRVDHASVALAETRSAFAEARALVDSRLAFAREHLQELAALQGKNQKLVETLAKKAGAERARLEKARTDMIALRTVHNRHADELARLLNPNSAREAGIQARMAMLNTRFSGGIGQVVDAFFAKVRADLERAIVEITAVKAMMIAAQRTFADFGMSVEALPEFGTERFLVEVSRVQARSAGDFRSAASLLMRGRRTLGALFFDDVALKVIHVFEIADREVRTWMNGFIRPLDAQLNAFQEQTNARIEGMGRIQNAETDLVTRLDELQALIDEVEGQRAQLETQRERLEALLEVSREHSLA